MLRRKGFIKRIKNQRINRIVERIKNQGIVISTAGGFWKWVRSVVLCDAPQGAFDSEVLIAWLKGSRARGSWSMPRGVSENEFDQRFYVMLRRTRFIKKFQSHGWKDQEPGDGDQYMGYLKMSSIGAFMWCSAKPVLYKSFNRMVETIKSQRMVTNNTRGFMWCTAGRVLYQRMVMIGCGIAKGISKGMVNSTTMGFMWCSAGRVLHQRMPKIGCGSAERISDVIIRIWHLKTNGLRRHRFL